MKFILLILIPTLLLKHICEAQVITTTSTIAISTTETEMSTQLVLGFCISQLDGPCRRKKQHYYQPYYPSSYGQIQSRNEDAFLYSPSFVEKLEVTLVDPGKGRFLLRNNEDPIITQSSLKEDNLLDHYNPYLYLRDGSSLSGRPLPTFFFFRPFANLWSSLARATRTVYQTITTTFKTTSYLQSTTSTATLFIKKCDDPANSANLHKKLLKCPQQASIDFSTTPLSSSTIPSTTITNSPMITITGEATTTNETATTDWTSTTSHTIPITNETTPPISSSTSSTTTSLSSITIHTTLESTTASITNVPVAITNETTSTDAGTSTTSQTTFITDQTSPFSTTNETTTDSITTAETTTDSITTDETTMDWITTDETTTDWITTDEITTNWITTDETTTGWVTTDETTTDWTTPTDGPCTTDETSTEVTDTTTEGTTIDES